MHTNSFIYTRIRLQWLSELRWLWLSVPWQVACMLAHFLIGSLTMPGQHHGQPTPTLFENPLKFSKPQSHWLPFAFRRYWDYGGSSQLPSSAKTHRGWQTSATHVWRAAESTQPQPWSLSHGGRQVSELLSVWLQLGTRLPVFMYWTF